MRGNKVLGIIFANTDDSALSELTGIRSMASVPFGGGFRAIDFVLSNMVNAGVNKVGVITNTNYQSLMDQIGGGKPWDLTGRNSGIYILPPFNALQAENYRSSRIGALRNVSHFLGRCTEEYVLLTDCTYISNIDFSDVFASHTDSQADITVLYKNGKVPGLSNQLKIEKMTDGRIEALSAAAGTESDASCVLKCALMKKSLLERLLGECAAKSEESFEKAFLIDQLSCLNVRGYEIKGFCPVLDSLKSYFDANFALIDKNIYREMFFERPVYSKVYDDMPAVYGIKGDVRASLIADGCVINGTVENSVLFRGVRVERGAVVRNSIVLPHGIISENALLNFAVTDKNVTICSGRNISGADSFPIYIGKGIRV